MSSRLPLSSGKKNTDATVLPEGSTLKGRFRIGAPFVCEGFVAYKGHDGDRPVVIIEAQGSDTASAAQLDQISFWAEQLGSSLTQELLDQFEISGYRYLVLEQMEGRTINAMISPIKGVFLQEKIVSEWAPSLYSLFKSLYEKNRESLYGNVIPWQSLARPDHLIRDREGRFRVILQGIPVLQADARGFAPPEMSERRDCDATSLVYIAGAILYYLITNGNERLTGTSSPRTINTRVSPHLERLLEKALAGHQALRFQSIDEMERFHFSRETPDSKPAKGSAAEESAPIISQKGLVYHVDTPADHAAEADFRKMAVYVGVFIVAAICILLVVRGWLGALIAREKAPSAPSTAATVTVQRHSRPFPAASQEPSAVDTGTLQPGDSTPDTAMDPFIASPPFGESAPQPTAEASKAEKPVQKPSVASAPALSGNTAYPMAVPQQNTPARPRETESPAEHLAIAPVSRENTKLFLTPREQILAGLLKRRASDFQEPEGRSTGNGTIVKGQSATSTSREPSFEITVPPGYYQIKSSRKNYLEFATIDRGSPDSSLRLLLVRPMVLPQKATPEQALGIYSMNLEQKGATNVKSGEAYVGNRLAYGFNYGMSVPLFSEPLMYSEIFFQSKDSNTVYILTQSAPESIYEKYKAEFTTFVNSFREIER